MTQILDGKHVNSKLSWGLVKDDVSPQDIFNFQKGTDSQRAIIGKYCIQDCVLCLNIMDKIMVMPNNVGMSNVCIVPLSFIFLRGQMIKALSLVSKFCREAKFLLPVLPRVDPDAPKESFEGAVVLEPKPAIYSKNPVAVVDYGSLYPSSMIAENISHDTHVMDEKYLGEEGAERLKKMGLDFVDITYDNYLSEMRGKQVIKKLHPTIPSVTCRFIQPAKNDDNEIDDSNRAILPQILLRLLGSRKATKKRMEKETDPLKKSILDGLQLAYKLTANSLYGAIGARVSKIYFPEGAASTTATGRNMLMMAKGYVERTFPKAKIVYGDSVTGDTPILVRIEGKFAMMTIEELFQYKNNNKQDDNKNYNQLIDSDIKVWTESGFTNVINVMRHKVEKPILRILTHTSCVDVTSDHSLLKENATEISPLDLSIGDKLLCSWPVVALENNNTTISEEEAKIMGLFFGDGTCGVYDCPSGNKSSWKLSFGKNDELKAKSYCYLCEQVYPQFKWHIKYYIDKRYNGNKGNMYLVVFTCREGMYGECKKFIQNYRNLMYLGKNKRVPDSILFSKKYKRTISYWSL